MLLCYGYWCVNVGTFEAGNVGFKANFKYTNKHKGDVQRQLLLSIQRHRALESLYDTESYSGTKRKRHSYLESVEPITRTNLDGSVDMLLNISVAPTTYKSFPVKYSATLMRNEVNVPTACTTLLRTTPVCWRVGGRGMSEVWKRASPFLLLLNVCVLPCYRQICSFTCVNMRQRIVC